MKLLKLLAALGVVSLLVITMTCRPKRDANKKLPDDVVRDFVTTVQAGDLQKARTYWSPESIPNIEGVFKMSFEDFCRKEFDCDEFVIAPAVKQKSVYWSVIYSSTCGGVSNSFRFYIKSINGAYHLVHG